MRLTEIIKEILVAAVLLLGLIILLFMPSAEGRPLKAVYLASGEYSIEYLPHDWYLNEQ